MENNISRIEYPLTVGAAFKADINGQGCFKCTAWINSDFIFAEAYGETEKEAEANASLIDDAVTIYNKSGKTPSELLAMVPKWIDVNDMIPELKDDSIREMLFSIGIGLLVRLTINELACYLPNKLQWQVTYGETGKVVIDEMVGCFANEDLIILSECGDCWGDVNLELWGSDEFLAKPLLRHLSQLTQNELRYAGFNSHIDYLTHEVQNPANEKRTSSDGKKLWRIEKAPYEMVEYLFKNHFDVFNLIERELAIDKSSIEKATGINH